VHRGPPSAKQVFEIYYYDEILPFLKKSGQQSIRGKKDLSNVWHIQTKAFKSFYEERSRILSTEWNKLSKEQKKMKKNKDRSSTLASTPRLHRKSSTNANKIVKNNAQHKKIKNKNKKKRDVRLIRTLLNFSLFLQCTLKDNSVMILVSDQKSKHVQYEKFEQERENKLKLKELVGLHLRIFIGHFDCDCLRLHTSAQMIKLCFAMNHHHHHQQHQRKQSEKSEELILFELVFDKLCKGMADRIDSKLIKASIEQNDCQILIVHIPMIDDKQAEVTTS